jgi:hypothetical protein
MHKKICDDFKENVSFSLYYPFDTHISANIDLKCLGDRRFLMKVTLKIKK